VNSALTYSGLTRRIAAFFIDVFIIASPLAILELALVVFTGSSLDSHSPTLDQLLYLTVALAYFALMQSSKHEATIGKKAMHIRLVDTCGKRLSLTRSFTRAFVACLTLGYTGSPLFFIPFTKRKQALHDLICGTVVIMDPEGNEA
jgi:uncharacterized RDD family membrane protein YckC